MVDTYLQPEVHIVLTQTPGVDGTPSTSRLTQIENDLATLLGRPVITQLADVPDVVGPFANGQVLVWDDTDEEWRPGSVNLPIQATAFGGTPLATAFRILDTTFGLTMTADEPFPGVERVRIQANFAGTGDANTIARSNHTHTLPANTRAFATASGTLSSGTRTLISGTVSGLNPAYTYLADAILIGDLRGEGSGAGYSQPRITLNSVTQTRFGGNGDVRTVAGVDREYSMHHGGVSVSGVSSFAYSATLSYQSGDPINVGAGELVIRLRANR